MTLTLAGKRAIVTGGASGIGAATAARFVREGAKVAICDLDAESAQALALELGEQNCRAWSVDVADIERVTPFISDAAAWLGGIDILVNNAGIAIPGTVIQLDPANWRKIFAVDVDSIFYASRIAIPIMIAAGGGAVVNIASISGLRGDHALVGYNAAKGAVVNLTRAMAVDHAPDNVRVNAVCPGLIETPLTQAAKDAGLWYAWTSTIPMRRAGTAEEMASVVAFLASEEASYVSGSVIVADGGMDAATGQPDLAKLASELLLNAEKAA
ncbi:3-oxoacyl-(acyl-carrier-protein) reductase [Sphingobium chlorophenolicum L-1]|uniref:3-oxoacyl-(Acyl-carrier-protein) reductase n=1 Tax=Sphingobium chlorophenolicum L-1 TaxID=690566 RepID=F6EUG5_SPHCR|nr:SDR family NAD(P)-dependent oxidoreductase [Sphingobium chlorophenolicum]AEG47859.1 3-oxoacyl-(acyl-carrier-protein) reductase [Sphingobium chlorophenolicum L-1]